MLTKEERTLLQNVIESLNQLFDRESTASDVRALLMATAASLRGGELADAFDEPIQCLTQIVALDALPDQKRDGALAATDDLCSFIAQRLLRDKRENPKQRHAVSQGGPKSST